MDDELARKTAGAEAPSGMTAILSADTPRPFLTAGLPGTGGAIKSIPEDFTVEEIPAFPFSGAGDHLVLLVEKRGMTTFQAAAEIAGACGVGERDVGFAGIKDAFAVARQHFSVEAASIPTLPQQLRVISASRHAHKLRAGMLAGNRFTVRIRGCEHPENAEPILAEISERGMPNFFGEQRFGAGRDVSAQVGRSLLAGDIGRALSDYVSVSGAGEPERTRAARQAFSEGKPGEAMSLFPQACFSERTIVSGLSDGEPPERVLYRAFPRRLIRLFLSAVQARIFNNILARRIDSIDRFLPGDIGMFACGATFFRGAQPGDPRLATLEVSPSGPLFGTKIPLADGEAGEMEKSEIARFMGDAAGQRTHFKGVDLTGTRRRLREKAAGISAAPEGERDLVLSFSLGKGTYATELLREVMKT